MDLREMKTFVPIVLIAMALLWPSVTLAGENGKGPRHASASQRDEVVSGNVYCSGNTFTDDQPASLSFGFYLGATSDLTSGYYPPSHRRADVPADLGIMAEICRAHVDVVRSQMSSICVVGDVETSEGDFGNGASVSSSIQFSCHGARNEVIGVIGDLGRSVVTAPASVGR